ncbi:hypothetical protein JCM1393_09090 [Clostridium carnis]
MKAKKSISISIVFAMIMTLLPVGLSELVVKAAATNLVVNGDFETIGSGGNASYWSDPSKITTGWSVSSNPSTPTANSPKISVVNDIIKSGNNGLRIDATNNIATRLFISKVIDLPSGSAGKKFRFSTWLKTNNITGNTIGFRFQQFPQANGRGTQISSVDVTKSGTVDWMQVNNDQIIASNAASVKISIIYGTSAAANGTAWVDDISLNEVIDDMTIPSNSISLSKGDTISLNPTFSPSAATNTVDWISSDSTIASVDSNGTVTALKDGKARITGTSTIDSSKSVYADINIVGILVQDVAIDKVSATMNVGDKVTLNKIITPSNASDQNVIWSSDTPSVASVNNNGVVTGLKPGKTKITAVSSSDSSKKATSDIEVNGLTVEQTNVSVPKGRYVLLMPAVMPVANLVWKSSDQSIATVDGGLVQALKPGNVTITVSTSDNKYTATSKITVDDYTVDEYDNLRERYKYSLIGGKNYNINDPAIQSMVNKVATSAQNVWSNMDKTKEYLWTNIPCIVPGGPKHPASEITSNYANLATMTKAFLMEGSSLKGNVELLRDIVRGLEWMNQNVYNKNHKVEDFVGANGTGNGNWWDFHIGSPKTLNDIVSMIYDYLTPEQVNRFESSVQYFQPDPKYYTDSFNSTVKSTGGNLSDTSKVSIIYGINTKDSKAIEAGRDAISENFTLVNSGEGIYKDGSFIQHSFVPYNNTYGQVLVQGISEILSALDGSTWSVTDPNVSNIYNWIEKGIAPLIYKGSAMDMASGRAIARGGYQDHEIGAMLIGTIIQIAQIAPEPYASNYKSMVKYWIQQDTYRDFVANSNDIIVKTQALKILNDATIKPAGELTGHFNFSNMDRVVHRTPSFSLGLSMYSNRTSNYETMNGENLHGWHTNDGMTYLYNGDIGNFANDFWPTVDAYRLPGTTVDTLKQPTSPSDQTASKIISPQSWVGGTTLGNFGVSGMFLDKRHKDLLTGNITNKLNMTLQAKKSWFMFDKEVVALGTGINSTDNRDIETIVDNRKINDTGTNTLTVDGIKKSSTLGWNETLNNVHWMHLEGNTSNSDVGYYFPDSNGVTINALREARTGAWSDIRSSASNTKITRNYVTTWFNHGANPTNDVYSYVLLPNMSASQVKDYYQNPDITVLVNTPEVQAVKKNSLNIIGANFWTDTIQSVDYITVNKKASVMTQISNGYLDISISDPTMENNGTIEIDIDKPNLTAVNLDSRIKVISSGNKTHISVDVSNAQGQAITARFK